MGDSRNEALQGLVQLQIRFKVSGDLEMATHSVILTHDRKVILNIPRDSSLEAAQACEVLKNYVVAGSDVEITITNDLELVDRLLEFTEKANRNPLVR